MTGQGRTREAHTTVLAGGNHATQPCGVWSRSIGGVQHPTPPGARVLPHPAPTAPHPHPPALTSAFLHAVAAAVWCGTVQHTHPFSSGCRSHPFSFLVTTNFKAGSNNFKVQTSS